MEKILLLADALNYKPENLDFASYIAKLGKSKLVGVFIENKGLKKTKRSRISFKSS